MLELKQIIFVVLVNSPVVKDRKQEKSVGIGECLAPRLDNNDFGQY